MRTEGPGEPILVGSVARAHGLLGDVVVDVFSDAPRRFAPGMAMRAGLKSGPAREVVVEAARPFGKRLLVRFRGITSRTEAEALHGADLTIARSDVMPLPAGRHYRFELLGLRVRTRGGSTLGTVEEVFSTGGNDVYVVRGPGGEILLPAIAGVVLEIDVARGEMVVEIPAGLGE